MIRNIGSNGPVQLTAAGDDRFRLNLLRGMIALFAACIPGTAWSAPSKRIAQLACQSGKMHRFLLSHRVHNHLVNIRPCPVHFRQQSTPLVGELQDVATSLIGMWSAQNVASLQQPYSHRAHAGGRQIELARKLSLRGLLHPVQRIEDPRLTWWNVQFGQPEPKPLFHKSRRVKQVVKIVGFDLHEDS